MNMYIKYYDLGDKSLTSDCGGPGLIPGMSTWNLWWTGWHWAGFSQSASVIPHHHSTSGPYSFIRLSTTDVM